ncbi:MAG: glycosyltransferase family 39 protein, partial [Nanoarchaeota archaeon]
MEKREIIFLSIVMIVVFLGQLYIADRVLFGDDYIFAELAENNKFFFTENAHPPLPVWSDILITEIFPLTNRTMRLTSIIFATLTIPLVYLLAKKTIGEKAAWIAALLAGFSAWHIRASQMNSGSDGGMFTFFFYLTLYFFLKYLETKQTKNKIGAGIMFGLTMLSKETGVLLIPVCGLYYCYTFWKRKKEATENIFMKESIINGIKNSAVICLIALVIWSIFPILDIIYNNNQSTDAIVSRINEVVIERESTIDYNYWFMTVFSIFKLLLWTGPLLLFLPLVSVMTKKEWKQEGIFILLILLL